MGGSLGVELGRTLGGASGQPGNDWGRNCWGARSEEMSCEGSGACLSEGLHYRGILPGVCEHSTCDKRQSREGKSRLLVLWDARVVGERKVAEEESLVFAAMSGSGFRSPKM